jgi:chromate transporter
MAERIPPVTGVAMPRSWDLFWGFFSIGINGFGGVMPWARRMLVEQRRWLTPEEFVDALAMCQFVPGPNVVNLAVALGGRFRGPFGALAGMLGILAAPMAIVIGAYMVLVQVAEAPVAIGAIRGMSAAASGLIVALAVKVGTPLAKKRDWLGLAIAAAAALAVGILRLPLLPALAVLAPLSIALHWRRR